MGLNNFTGNSGNNNNGSGGGSGFPGGFPGGLGGMMPGGDAIDPLELVINYNDKFKNSSPAMFRDELIQQTMAVLIGKDKPNALLIGPAGVGKTKIVEHLAMMLANNDPLLPTKLNGCVIYELPLSNIVAGSSYVGQVEEKLKAVIDFMADPKNRAILFIDEIHQLVGESQTYEKIAQILKPALARGEIRTIGATTVQESANLANDPAFNRRFSRLPVDEPTPEQTVQILIAARMGFVTHYSNKVAISDDLMPTVVAIADEYSSAGSHRPDNALTLLDRTLGDAVVHQKVLEQKAQNDPTLLAALKAMPIIPITEKMLRKTAHKLTTGHSKKDALDVQNLRNSLSRIKGQDEIITRLITLLRRHDLNLFSTDKKPLMMMFAGPSGVGKTEVTKIIANELIGIKPITLNMGEFHSPASINRIIGAPAGYVGYNNNGEMPFDVLDSNPYQVILLDEFEKCHIEVQQLFMSAFDEGYMKTNRGKVIDFSKAIIIATTNAAHTSNESKSVGFVGKSNTGSTKSQITDLTKWFEPAILGRFQSNIFKFNELTEDVYREIIIAKYHKEVARIRQIKPRIALLDDIPDADLDEMIAHTYIPALGARPAEQAVREYIENQVL